jgi:hypothetical protein
MKHRSAGLLLMIPLCCASVRAADQTKEVVAALKKKADSAVAAFTVGEARASAEKLQKAVVVLERKAAAGSNSEYIASLESDRKAIEIALESPDSSKALPLLNAARADVVRKAEHAQKSSGAGTSLAETVYVSVKTVRGGQEVSGYLVRANPMTAPQENPPRFVFTNPSSPSKRGMPPGEFLMWLEKEGQQIQRRPVSIGGDGEPEQEIIFDVP